ncbi:MAG TPA: hypothetical protein VL359_12815, partial [bacterium]|nr:hypothetical protein [bacterium]
MPESLRQLHANCGALAARDPRLAEIVLSARPSGGFSSERARTGHLVPLVHREGSGVYLHSRYDPVREAARRTVEWEGAGFLVAIGLGGGFHIDAMLHSRGVGLVVVVEKDASVLRTLFSLLPLEALLESPRVILANGPSDAGQKVLQFWHPALAGSLSAATLGPWCALERTFCQAASDAVRKAVETVRADYSVQAHFGKRWFLNMVRNLPRALPPEARP